MYTDYLAQSQVLLEAGLLQEALTPLNVGIALYPQEPELWFAKYKILKALGSPEAWHALTECRRWGPSTRFSRRWAHPRRGMPLWSVGVGGLTFYLL